MDVIATAIGLADLRGLAPRERAETITRNCTHPTCRELASDYLRWAIQHAGHTPHLLEEAIFWHVRAQ